jgi:rod shape-determining protein MreD
MKVVFLILATFFVAFLLAILTMPNWSLWARPEWVLLVLIYWALAFPEHCGVLTAGCVGLLQDSLTASPLGKHMIAFALITAIVVAMHRRFRMYDLWYQARFIFLFVLIEYLIFYFVDKLAGNPTLLIMMFAPALISALIWPWLMVVLRGLRRRFGLTAKIG